MTAKSQKVTVEVLLAGVEIGGIKPQPHLVKTTRLLTVDLVCLRASIAKKTAAKEVKFQKVKADLKGQGWTERVMFRGLMQKYTVGIDDIASAPLDALAQMEGTYPGPKTIAQGALDVTEDMLPEPGKSVTVEVPLHRPKFAKTIGCVKLEL